MFHVVVTICLLLAPDKVACNMEQARVKSIQGCNMFYRATLDEVAKNFRDKKMAARIMCLKMPTDDKV